MLYSIVSGDFLTMCECVLCDWGRDVGEGDGERNLLEPINLGLGGLFYPHPLGAIYLCTICN